MIKYLVASLLFIFPFSFQTKWKCLENGLYDIISKPINYKACKYNDVYTKDNVKVKIADKATLVLTRKDIKNGNYILFGKDKIIINDKVSKKNNINYNYGLLGMYSFKNKEGTFYLLELDTDKGLNLNSSATLIILFSKNKMYVSFFEWNSGDNSATCIGMNNEKLFILNYDILSIGYFEFENKKFVYNSKKSTKCKTDRDGKIWIPSNYKF